MRLRSLLREESGARLIPADGQDAQAAGAVEVTDLTADSREVTPGALFAALPGTVHDGAAYIPDALARGAVAILGVQGVRKLAAETAGVPFVASGNPRQTLAHLARAFFGAQPGTVVAVTGTNGKSSTVSFTRQLWAALGRPAASMGTLGVRGPDFDLSLGHTTPDPVTVHRTLKDLAGRGIDHLALEASSHGLAQFRLDGVAIAAGAFTNFTRDHLDFHGTLEDYLYAKLRLFSELIAPGGTAILNLEMNKFAAARETALGRGLKIVTVGTGDGAAIRLADQKPEAEGQRLTIEVNGGRQKVEVTLPLIGTFQATNALMAAALVMATSGKSAEEVLPHLARLQGARGRLQKVARLSNGASVFVDYAHTPDALETVLRAIRPHCAGVLHLVMGAGGDRDRGKRPEMGQVAAALADRVIVTDDNPRTEDPDTIRAEIMAGVTGGAVRDVPGRAEAIATAVAALGPGDLLVIAGKGHECGQEIAGTVHSFDDGDVARAAVTAREDEK